MLELIIFFIIAASVVTMLYMVLGKQVGEAPETPFVDEIFGTTSGPNETAPQERRSRHYSGDGGEGLALINAGDDSFNPDEFIDGAKAAYAMILEAYADGDLETLEALLSDEMFAAYKEAIEARAAQGLTQTTDLARLLRADFVSASSADGLGEISVEYEAEIASAMTNEQGEVVDGDLDTLSRVTEIWAYERRLRSATPDWKLISVTEAGEDTFGSAPDFTPKA
ncbi:MAG: Tim44/TimA family putative adaptor protein [Robiginitomaculum sp.]